MARTELEPRLDGVNQVVGDSGVAKRSAHAFGRGWRYYRDLVAHLVGSQLTARYRRSLLGWLWAVALPLAQLGVFYFVFTEVMPTAREHFLLFLFTGIITWSWFANALTGAATSLVGRRDLVLRPGFPTVILPIVAVLVAMVDYLLAFPLLLIGAIVALGFHPVYVLLPALIAAQFVFTAGLSLLVAPLNVFFRDVAHLLGVALTLFFFVSPVLYSGDQVPARFASIYALNPMAQLIDGYRTILLERRPPDAMSLTITAAAAMACLVIGMVVFNSLRHRIPDSL